MKIVKDIWHRYLKLAVASTLKGADKNTINPENTGFIIRFGYMLTGLFAFWGLFDIIKLQYYKSPLIILDLLYGIVFWPVFWISTGIIVSHFKGSVGVQLLFGLFYLIFVFGILNSVSYMDFWTFMRLFMAINMVYILFTLKKVFKTIFQGIRDGTIILPEGDSE